MKRYKRGRYTYTLLKKVGNMYYLHNDTKDMYICVGKKVFYLEFKEITK